MSADWERSEEWQAFVNSVREGAVKQIDSSSLFLSIVPDGEPDIKYAVELGLALMMDKPIVLVALPGREIPKRVRRVADRVVEADMDTEAGREAIGAALKSLIGEAP